MKVSDLFLHSRAILRNASQKAFLVAVVCIVAALLISDLPRPWAIGFSAVVVLIGVAAILRSELRLMRTYHLTLFPHGEGTLRPHANRADARMLSFAELSSRFRYEEGGIRVGRLLPQHRPFGVGRDIIVGPSDDRHMLTIAGGRTGKGTAAVIPNLLVYPGSVLVIDPKGELAQITAARRGKGSKRVTESLGQDVFVFDPDDITVGLPKACWNPLAELRLEDPRLWTHVARIATYIIPSQPTKQADEFFLNHARDLLTAVILHVLTTEEEVNHNLIYVRKMITQGDGELFQFIIEECQQLGTAPSVNDPVQALLSFMADSKQFSGKLAGIAMRVLSMADATQTGVLGTLVEQTGFLDDPGMEAALIRSDFSLADLKLRPTSVYLCMKGTSFATNLVKILYVFLEMAIFRMEDIPGKPPYHVLFIMDEFYTMGRSEAIDRAIGLIAGYGVTLWPILQHIGQLKTHYPNTWDNFKRNCRAIQYFGDQEPESLKELEQRIGTRTVKGQQVPLFSQYDLSSNYFVRSGNRQIVVFQQEPVAALELTHYYNSFPQWMYEDDPRAADRSHYAAWNR
jgi:type IV secretion system protein VirD4